MALSQRLKNYGWEGKNMTFLIGFIAGAGACAAVIILLLHREAQQTVFLDEHYE